MTDDAVVPPDAAEAKDRLRHMFSDMAHSYGDGAELFDVFGRGLVGVAAIRPGERVLDLACGRGACLRPASEAVGSGGYVLGLDLSPTMVELTAEELRLDGVANAKVRVGDAEHLDLDDESFNVVTCGFGVFFFRQPAAALTKREAVRALKRRISDAIYRQLLHDAANMGPGGQTGTALESSVTDLEPQRPALRKNHSRTRPNARTRRPATATTRRPRASTSTNTRS